VPGFAKQTSIPAFAAVSSMLTAAVAFGLSVTRPSPTARIAG
jgi:acyl dehydratase